MIGDLPITTAVQPAVVRVYVGRLDVAQRHCVFLRRVRVRE